MNNNEMTMLESWVEAAVSGEFKLPVCVQCDSVIYPPRENCPHCLCSQVSWEAVDNMATVLASTCLEHTLEPRYRGRLPWYVFTVKLDVGPVAIVSGTEDIEYGDRVGLRLQFDPSETHIPVIVAKRCT